MIKTLTGPAGYKKIFLFFILAILIIDILSISYFRILDRFELVTLDFRYSLRLILPQRVNPDIAIIEIGEDTLQLLGKWPLPRDYHSSLIDVLSQFGAKSVMFDILFCEPTARDLVFAESAKKAGNVYFPFAFRLEEKYKRGLLEATDIDAPLLEDLRLAARGTGYINKITDIDGKVRRLPLLVRYKGGLYPSMAFQVACDYKGIESNSLSFDNRGRILFGEGFVPVDENGIVLLNFAGRWIDTFKHYSYLDILAAYQELSEGRKPRIDLAQLKGKVCFIGLTATGTQELGPIPIENTYPMLGVHVNLFNMLTQNTYLKRFSRIGNLSVLIVLVLMLLFLILHLRPFTAFFVSLGVVSVFLISALTLFALKGFWVDMVCPALMLFGTYLAVTINRYISEIKVRERMQKELTVASSIQKCFLPEEVPVIEGLDIAVAMKTAKEVGGDLYDFVKLGDNKLGIMIGDVAGKGVPASLFMARIETLFKVYSKNEAHPAVVISKLNNEVSSDERSGLFTTIIYAIFDATKNELLFSDAGHLPMILVHNGKAQRLVSQDGMAVGIMEDVAFLDKAIKLSKGDVAVLYTDGISEGRDPKGNEFGIENLMALVEKSAHLSAKEILKSIMDHARKFQGKAIQHDDMTIIIVRSY